MVCSQVNVGSRFVKRSSSSASSRLQRRGFVGLVPQVSSATCRKIAGEAEGSIDFVITVLVIMFGYIYL